MWVPFENQTVRSLCPAHGATEADVVLIPAISPYDKSVQLGVGANVYIVIGDSIVSANVACHWRVGLANESFGLQVLSMVTMRLCGLIRKAVE